PMRGRSPPIASNCRRPVRKCSSSIRTTISEPACGATPGKRQVQTKGGSNAQTQNIAGDQRIDDGGGARGSKRRQRANGAALLGQPADRIRSVEVPAGSGEALRGRESGHQG